MILNEANQQVRHVELVVELELLDEDRRTDQIIVDNHLAGILQVLWLAYLQVESPNPLQDALRVHALKHVSRPIAILAIDDERVVLLEFVQVVYGCLQNKWLQPRITSRHHKRAGEHEDEIADIVAVSSDCGEDFACLLRIEVVLAKADSDVRELVDYCWPICLEAISAILFSLDLLNHKGSCLFERAKMIPRVDEPLCDLAAVKPICLQNLSERTRSLGMVGLDLVVWMELSASCRRTLVLKLPWLLLLLMCLVASGALWI